MNAGGCCCCCFVSGNKSTVKNAKYFWPKVKETNARYAYFLAFELSLLGRRRFFIQTRSTVCCLNRSTCENHHVSCRPGTTCMPASVQQGQQRKLSRVLKVWLRCCIFFRTTNVLLAMLGWPVFSRFLLKITLCRSVIATLVSSLLTEMVSKNTSLSQRCSVEFSPQVKLWHSLLNTASTWFILEDRHL